MKHYKILLLLAPFYLQAHTTTLIINQYPSNTPENAKLYLAGNINNWNPGDANYAFTKNKNNYTLTLAGATNALEFKITLGSWEQEETDKTGQSITNRTIKTEKDTVYIQVLGWKSLTASGENVSSTMASNVSVLSDFFMPQLNRSRNIWVYTPPDYQSNPKKKYPVLYMHDGQNMFDAKTSFSGEWSVDESLNTLFKAGDQGAIVVGIDNGDADRIAEYTPWANSKYGGGEGSKYIDFIVETLIPYINANYRTLNTRESTGIMGSSLGGLISFYGGIKFQNTFGKIGVFSPSFWFTDDIYTFAKTTGFKQNTRMFFLAGAKEDSTLTSKVNEMHKLLRQKAFNANEIKIVVKEDGQHSEWFWKREFPAAYQWLFSEFNNKNSK